MPIPSKPLTRLAAMATLALLASAPVAHASTNVGVSVSVNQPGFYGRVDIGDQPPVLLYPQPVIIQQTPYGARQRPIYMYVPPGHSKNWSWESCTESDGKSRDAFESFQQASLFGFFAAEHPFDDFQQNPNCGSQYDRPPDWVAGQVKW